MTLQEARQQVDDCERQVVNAYDSMQSAARTVGTSAFWAAVRIKETITIFSLIISFVIFVLFLASHPYFAIVVLIVCVCIGYSLCSMAKKCQDKVEDLQKTLNSTLDKSRI